MSESWGPVGATILELSNSSEKTLAVGSKCFDDFGFAVVFRSVGDNRPTTHVKLV